MPMCAIVPNQTLQRFSEIARILSPVDMKELISDEKERSAISRSSSNA